MPPPSGESEIEIVSESKNNSNSAPRTGETTVVIADVFAASAYGNMEKLRKFVEEDGIPLSKPDKNGYYALQWASLNNYPHVAQYIIEIHHTFSKYVSWFIVKIIGSILGLALLLKYTD